MTIVLDASGMVKLVLEENYSSEVRRIVYSSLLYGEDIYVPDFSLAEALNAIWKHVYLFKDVSDLEGEKAVSDLLDIWERLNVYSSTEIAVDALRIAVKEGLTLYDSLYITLARKLDASLVTFDQKLREKSRKLGIKVLP